MNQVLHPSLFPLTLFSIRLTCHKITSQLLNPPSLLFNAISSSISSARHLAPSPESSSPRSQREPIAVILEAVETEGSGRGAVGCGYGQVGWRDRLVVVFGPEGLSVYLILMFYKHIGRCWHLRELLRFGIAAKGMKYR